jgi:YfiH family protein
MNLKQADNIRYYSFESFEEAGVVSAAFTRNGGVSPAPWISLNVGGTVGDDPQRVFENRRRSFAAVGRSLGEMFDVWQVHSTEVVKTECPRPTNEPHRKADAILTDRDSVALFMRFADCAPVLLYDPVHRAIGLVHAGWAGTVNKIGKAAVQAMQACYGTDPVNLLAGIGPSIGPDHYPIGEEVVLRVNEAFGQDAPGLLKANGKAVHFDLWSANKLVLEQAGVKEIEEAGICTACHLDEWYSHRGEMGKTGRYGFLFALESR